MVDFDVGAGFAQGNRIVARTNILQNLYRDKTIFETPNEVINAPRNLSQNRKNSVRQNLDKQDNPETNLHALKSYNEDESRADNIRQKTTSNRNP